MLLNTTKTLTDGAATPIDDGFDPNAPAEQPPLSFLQNIWYYGAHSHQIKVGQTLAKTICGESVLLGRDKSGQVFAINNICVHQGMPLQYGDFDGKTVGCSFHGWRFDTQGACTDIPSLVADQKINVCRIKTKTYQCKEEHGSIWVFIGDKAESLPPPPKIMGLEQYPYQDHTKNTFILPSNIDIAVIGLMDPAHIAYVHTSWWFSSRKSIHDKAKAFEPKGLGYAMVRHKASKNATVYKVLHKLFGGAVETEIKFELPGSRTEHICIGNHTLLTLLTTLTPIDEERTELNHSTYWVFPFISLFKPLIYVLSQSFLKQDVDFSIRQSEGLRTKPKNLIMTIRDAGTPVRWYYQLKAEWTKALAEKRPFANPLKPETLRWRS